MVVSDLKFNGIPPVYLVTDHTGLYKRYGWEFLCMVQGDGEPDMSRMFNERRPDGPPLLFYNYDGATLLPSQNQKQDVCRADR